MNNAMEPKVETVETIEGENRPAPPQPRVPRSLKTWSENKQKFFYKPLDPAYTMRHYYKHKRNMECSICGSVVTTQMHKHIKSRRCLSVKEAIQKTIAKINMEEESESSN